MTKYRVIQEFTAASGAVYKKGSTFDSEEGRIPEEELTQLHASGQVMEVMDTQPPEPPPAT